MTHNISSYNVKLKDVDSNLYTINFAYYKLNTTYQNWQIIIDFKYDSLNETILVVKILYPINDTYYKLTFHEMTAKMPAYILKDLKESSRNQTIQVVTPSLSYFDRGKLQLDLSFSYNFTEFFDILTNISSLQIENFEKKNYNYSIEPTSSKNVFNLTLYPKKFILGSPILTITFDVPGYLIYHPYYKLSEKNVSIKLVDFYLLDQNAVDKIKNMRSFYNFLEEIIVFFAFIHGGLNFGFLSFHGIEALFIIKSLRFMEIKYPPQATICFNQDKSTNVNFFELENEKNDKSLPFIYSFYGMTKNFLQMQISKIKILVSLFILGGSFKILTHFLKYKKGIIVNLALKIKYLFCMNLFFQFYFSYLMEITLSVCVNFKYYTGDSIFEVLSLIISVFWVIIVVILYILLYKALLKGKKQTK